MKLALAGTILVGAAVGLALPDGGGGKPASRAAVAAAVVAAATIPARAASPAAATVAGETRLRRGESGHFFTTATIDGQPVQVVVDTGASIVALTQADAQRIGIPYSAADFQVIGSGASGPVRGVEVSIDMVSVDGKEVHAVRGAVIEGLDVSLLGQSYLSRISAVSMSGDEMVLR